VGDPVQPAAKVAYLGARGQRRPRVDERLLHAPTPPPPAGTLCGPAALVAGAVVHEAGLVLGPLGLRFTSVILISG
jgi:hypothetical protein